MAERLTFTLAGRDELSRVMNGSADSADRLRLRLAGIIGDTDGRLRDLQGQFISLADAQGLVDDRSGTVQRSMTSLSESGTALGESLRANLISLLPAAIPAAAGLASSAAVLAGQLGAVTVAAGAYALALGPQVGALGDAVQAQQKWQEAVRTSGAASKEALKAQTAYEQQLSKLPPATREAALAVGILKDSYKEWSDSLAGVTLAPFTKGVAVAGALLPRTTGLVKGASAQFDRLITLVGGAISTPGFDALTGRFETFTTGTLTRGIDRLTVFLAKLQSGDYSGGALQDWWDYAQSAGPQVFETLQNVADALLNVLEAGSGVGVNMLEVVNVLTGIVAAVPPEAIAVILQLAIAIKAVNLAAAGGAAASAAVAALGVQIGAMRAAAQGAPTVLAATSAAVGTLSKTAKLAMAGTGIGLLLITLDALSSKSRETPPDVDKLTVSLTELGRSGKVTGEALRAYGSDLSALSDALNTIYNPSGFEGFLQDWAEFIGTDSTGVKNAKEQVAAIDQALASLVSQGKAAEAAAGLDMTIKKLGLTGKQARDLRRDLNGYNDALSGQALEQRMAAESMGLFGAQAQQVSGRLDQQKASADGLRQSLQALNDVNRAGLSAQIAFDAALDATATAAAENAGVLDMQGGRLVTNTEKQRAAASALTDLASKTDAATASARESGESWQTVNGIYERGRTQLIANAMQMGLNRQQARMLADQILKTPDKTARLKGDIEDLKAKIADAKERLRRAPAEKRTRIRGEIADLKAKLAAARADLASVRDKNVRITATYYRRGDGASFMGPSGRYAQGGLIKGYPGGGFIDGEGTDTSDSNLIAASRGEYMVRAAAVRWYGRDVMDAVNSMQLPIGRPAPAGRPAPRAQAAGSSAAGRAVTYNVYPRQSVIGVEDLQLLQRQEEARQRVGRPG